MAHHTKPAFRAQNTLYRMFIGDRFYKTYDNVGHLKNAIHQRETEAERITIQLLEVEVVQVLTPADLMGDRCPHCGHYPTVNERGDRGYYHDYYCPLHPTGPREMPEYYNDRRLRYARSLQATSGDEQ